MLFSITLEGRLYWVICMCASWSKHRSNNSNIKNKVCSKLRISEGYGQRLSKKHGGTCCKVFGTAGQKEEVIPPLRFCGRDTTGHCAALGETLQERHWKETEARRCPSQDVDSFGGCPWAALSSHTLCSSGQQASARVLKGSMASPCEMEIKVCRLLQFNVRWEQHHSVDELVGRLNDLDKNRTLSPG